MLHACRHRFGWLPASVWSGSRWLVFGCKLSEPSQFANYATLAFHQIDSCSRARPVQVRASLCAGCTRPPRAGAGQMKSQTTSVDEAGKDRRNSYRHERSRPSSSSQPSGLAEGFLFFNVDWTLLSSQGLLQRIRAGSWGSWSPCRNPSRESEPLNPLG